MFRSMNLISINVWRGELISARRETSKEKRGIRIFLLFLFFLFFRTIFFLTHEHTRTRDSRWERKGGKERKREI